MKGLLGLVMLVWIAAGCRTSGGDPLRLHAYSRNVIIYDDGRVAVESRRVGVLEIAPALRDMAVANTSHVAVHFQRGVPVPVFDRVVAALREAGYENLSFTVFDRVP